MSNKMITIKGKEVSEDTIVEALKKHIRFEEIKTYPIIATCQLYDNNDRLVINITQSMRSVIECCKNVKQIVIDKNGTVCNSRNTYELDIMYKNMISRFGQIKK